MDEPTLMYFAMWHARCEILRHSTRESCILSTKLLCDLMNQLGVKAMPVAVDVIGLNQVALEKEQKGEEFDATDPDERAFGARCKVDPDSEDPEGTNWPGHLVLIAGGRFMLDPSADQFARADYDYHVRPTMIEFEDDDQLETWLYDGVRQGFLLPEGGMLTYEAHPDVVTYRTCSDWEDSHPGDGLYDSVMAKTHGLIGIYEDVEELPDLPDLPPARSARDPMTDEAMADTLKSMKELGYSVGDLVGRKAAEKDRVRRRKAELARRRGHDVHDRIAQLGKP
jgi:hypothetical protein